MSNSVSWNAKRAAVVGLCLIMFAAPGFAQDKASSCISELQSEFSSNAALTVDCPSKSDCSFLAAPGNAGAQEVIQSIAAKAATCLQGAGQTLANEDDQSAGITREFQGAGEARCIILIAKPGSESPQGVRVVCQDG